MSEWTAGVALDNQEAWSKAFNRLNEKHVLINPSSARAVKNKEVCIFDPEIYLKNRETVVFQNQKYRKFAHLAEKYNNCKNPNYRGVEEFRTEFDKLVKEYFEKGILRWATEAEIPSVQINPLNVIKTKESKFSLIIHSIHNSRYSKPDMNLMDILNRGQQLRNAKEYMVIDMKSCYHQFRLSKKSVLALGCKIDGKVAVWQTMGYGPSPAVYIVNNLVNYAVLDAALTHDTFAEAFIDDVFIAAVKPEIKKDLENIGLQFSSSKTQIGQVVDYCGCRLNARDRTVEILPKTYQKLKDIRESSVFTNRSGESAMEFSKLQEFCGVVVHSSRTSTYGLSKAFYLLGKLALGINDSENMVKLEKEEIDEIDYWCDTKHIISMNGLKTSGTTIKIFTSDPYKKQKIEASSDASPMWWGCKVNGKAYCDVFPEEFRNQPIAVLEMYALYMVIKFMNKNQKMIVSVDNTNTHFSFLKRRSKNQLMNELLIKIAEELVRNNKTVVTRWIPTAEMASKEGSDRLSRMKLDESYDPNSLNSRGAEIIKRTFGDIDVDLFSSPRNNIFETKYCSTFYVMTDPLNMQEEGLSFITSRKLKGRFWAFPPEDLSNPVIDLITQIDWTERENKLQILLLLKGKKVKDAISALWQLRKTVPISWSQFYKTGETPKYLNSKCRNSLILFIIGKYTN